jgi:hypothetical protein
MVDSSFNINPISSLSNISKIDPTNKDPHEKKDNNRDNQHSEKEPEYVDETEQKKDDKPMDNSGIDILA